MSRNTVRIIEGPGGFHGTADGIPYWIVAPTEERARQAVIDGLETERLCEAFGLSLDATGEPAPTRTPTER